MIDLERMKKAGLQSGKYYIMLFFSILIILLYNTREYVKFNELSELGVIRQSALVFNITNILSGFLLYQYFSKYLYYSRLIMNNLNITIILGKISALGQIGLGIFPNTFEMHYFHLIFTALFFSMATLSILNYCINIDNPKLLKYFGYFITFYSIAYPFYLRKLPLSKGIWQIAFALFILMWFIFEARIFIRYNQGLEKGLENHPFVYFE